MATIWFDMDGTIADFYGVDNWLDYLINENIYPYSAAKSLVNMKHLSTSIKQLQKKGYRVGIISWLSKCGSTEYNQKVIQAKLNWLKKHIPSVVFDEINIIQWGVPKSNFAKISDFLIDDEEQNRIDFIGDAIPPEEMDELFTIIS